MFEVNGSMMLPFNAKAQAEIIASSSGGPIEALRQFNSGVSIFISCVDPTDVFNHLQTLAILELADKDEPR
jgi:hypothetical protein